MPRAGPKQIICILCNKRTKPKERRPVQKDNAKILRRCFVVFNITNTSVICNKCSHKCYKIRNEGARTSSKHVNVSNDTTDQDFKSAFERPRTIPRGSPPSIRLSIPSTSTSHSYCFVCKRPGPKLLVTTLEARFAAFIRNEIYIPAGSRCCSSHLSDGQLTSDALRKIRKVNDEIHLNRSSVLELLQKARETLLQKSDARVDFDDPSSLTDLDYNNLTGLSKNQFDDLMSYVTDVRASKSRSVRTCVAILLTKLRCALDNRMLGTLFNMSKFQIRRAVASARKALMSSFVPENLGFGHISRQDVIDRHTRPLAKQLFTDNITQDPAILVLDGTYIYMQKSGNFSFQRRSYNLHKHRPLVKPMMFVTTTGYIVSVLGPYLADNKNSDASILNHMVATNAEEMKDWIREEDVFVVDRGFRDSSSVLADLGVKMEMPAFLSKGNTQHPTEEANSSRLVTKVRWVVESANGRIKTWRYLDRTLRNTQIPFIGDYVRIISALCNKYRPPLSTGNEDEDTVTAAKMRFLCKESKSLQKRVEEEGMDKRSCRWKKVDALDAAPNFPKYSEDDVRALTLGIYQVKLAKSYTQEHLDTDGG